MTDPSRKQMEAALAFVQRREAAMFEYKVHYAATLELPVNERSDEQINDGIAARLGLPLDTVLTLVQLKLSIRSKLRGADLAAFDSKEEAERSNTDPALWEIDQNALCDHRGFREAERKRAEYFNSMIEARRQA